MEAILKLLEGMIHGDAEEELTEEERRATATRREYFRQKPDNGISFERVVADCSFTTDQVRQHRNE